MNFMNDLDNEQKKLVFEEINKLKESCEDWIKILYTLKEHEACEEFLKVYKRYFYEKENSTFH